MKVDFHRLRFRIAAAALLFVALGLVVAKYFVDRYMSVAEKAITDGDWKRAREAGSTYLRVHPKDAAARLLMAQALIRDNKLHGEEKVYQALEHLNKIPETSALAGDARLYEGRLHLLLLMQPGEAERRFRLSLQHDPKRIETNSLLWRLYDLTNRWELGEEPFWRIYEQTPAGERATLLRNWYLSEFSPGAANIELDRSMGFLSGGEHPSTETDRRRLESFIAAEPQWPEGYVILARWFHRQGALHEAEELLNQAERLPGAANIPSFIGLRTSINIESGEFGRARLDFERWPLPHQGYDFWKTAGLVADQILQDNKQACEAYENAISTTPGKSDWLTQHRLAQCLLRSGDSEKAATVRQHSKQVELLMEPSLHIRLRRALLSPHDPNTISQMVDLYQQLGRDREVNAWKRLRPADEQEKQTVSEVTKSKTALESVP